MFKREPQALRIGELLLSFGIGDQKIMDEALSMAVRTGLPIGKVIIESGVLSPANLTRF